jgi:hypothetical protein
MARQTWYYHTMRMEVFMPGFPARPSHGRFTAKLFLVTALSLLAVQASLAKPSESSEAEVKDCQFLGKVEGSSGYGKNLGWQPLAKFNAAQKADKLGASHVVWQQFITVGAFNGVAVARAYSCP